MFIQCAAELRTRHRAWLLTFWSFNFDEMFFKVPERKLGTKIGTKIVPKWAHKPRKSRLGGPKIYQISILCALVALGRSWWRLGGVLGAFWDRFERLLVPNLVSKMEPRCSKNRSKNRSFFWCLLESIFGWILVEFRAKTKPSWHQNGIKIDVYFESRFLIIRALPAAGAGKIKIWGSKLGSKNRPKINPKMMSKMECILASIFDRF